MKRIGTVIKTLVVTIVMAVVGVLAFAWSGTYPVSVGSGHTAPVAWLLETTRERSVAVRSADLIVPDDLDSSKRIATGAGHYDAMCAGCHGKPGQGPAKHFDPAPPALSRHPVEPREAFWTIKHGLKMTAMPSHLDHSDEDNWDTVAFVQALPTMNANEYETLTADATHEHGDGGGHDHGEGSGQDEHSEDSAKSGPGNDMAASGDDHAHEMDFSNPRGTVNGFRHALSEGRAQDALAYLHPRATIVEGGHVQTVDEYRAGHLGSDMAFLRQVEIQRLSQAVQSSGGQATIETRSRFTGEIDGESIDLESSEFATLIETEEGWRISQVAWNSAPFAEGESNATQPNGHSHQDSPEGNDHEH